MGKTSISELCKQHDIGTGQYYRWQQMFFNGAIEGLRHTKSGRRNSVEERLKEENERFKSVISDLASENLKLKSELEPAPAQRRE